MLLRLARSAGRLQIALVRGRERVDHHSGVRWTEHVLDHAAMEGKPVTAARGIRVEDVDPVAADEMLGVENRLLPSVEQFVTTAQVLEALEQLVGSAAARECEPSRAQGWNRGLVRLALRPVLGLNE